MTICAGENDSGGWAKPCRYTAQTWRGGKQVCVAHAESYDRAETDANQRKRDQVVVDKLIELGLNANRHQPGWITVTTSSMKTLLQAISGVDITEPSRVDL